LELPLGEVRAAARSAGAKLNQVAAISAAGRMCDYRYSAIAAHAAGEASATEATAARAHLGACVSCRKVYAQLRREMHRRLIFPSPTGRVWGQRNFYRDVWDPASEEAGTGFTVYDLRHTFISHLLANGIPTVEVAAYAGHSTRQLGDLDNTTTRIYPHPTGEYHEAALEAIGSYLAQLDLRRRAAGR
jgi:integrase